MQILNNHMWSVGAPIYIANMFVVLLQKGLKLSFVNLFRKCI